MKAASLSNADILIKILVSLCLIALAILPIGFKSLYVEPTGNFKVMDISAVLLFIAGLKLNWRYIGEIIIGYMVLGLLVLVSFIIRLDELKPGIILTIALQLIIIIALLWLKWQYKRSNILTH